MVWQEWIDLHVKDTGNGPMVRQARCCPFWLKRGESIAGPYWLIAVRDRLDQETIKYFLSNASAGVPLEVLVHVGFSRWPVERCLEDEKSELGLSHFEVRKYHGVLRHLRITQVSHLFLARQTQRLAEKKSGGDDLPGAGRDMRVVRCLAAQCRRSETSSGQNRGNSAPNSDSQRGGPRLTRQNAAANAPCDWHPPDQPAMLYPSTKWVAL
jgi:hypothetical protein